MPGFLPAAEPVIKKVLPHYLDQEGRHTLAPSLYERDAYQDYLRNHPEACSALRFDVLFKADSSTNLQLRVQLRGTKDSKPTRLETASPILTHNGGRTWSHVTLPSSDFDRVGNLLAWKVTLLEGGRELASQASFLWQSDPPKAIP